MRRVQCLKCRHPDLHNRSSSQWHNWRIQKKKKLSFRRPLWCANASSTVFQGPHPAKTEKSAVCSLSPAAFGSHRVERQHFGKGGHQGHGPDGCVAGGTLDDTKGYKHKTIDEVCVCVCLSFSVTFSLSSDLRQTQPTFEMTGQKKKKKGLSVCWRFGVWAVLPQPE